MSDINYYIRKVPVDPLNRRCIIRANCWPGTEAISEELGHDISLEQFYDLIHAFGKLKEDEVLVVEVN